jgi:universal stress protein A
MSDYRNIVIATDFSEHSARAAARASQVAGSSDARITVLHVVTYIPPAYVNMEIPAPFSSEEYLRNRAQEHLAEWCNNTGLSDCTQVVKTGPAKRVVEETTSELGADLLIIGASGETGLVRAFGSVAGHIAQHAECDVLLVR